MGGKLQREGYCVYTSFSGWMLLRIMGNHQQVFKRQDATQFLSFKGHWGCFVLGKGSLAGPGRFLGSWSPSCLCGCWGAWAQEET